MRWVDILSIGKDIYCDRVFGPDIYTKDLVIYNTKILHILRPMGQWKDFKVRDGFIGSCIKYGHNLYRLGILFQEKSY